MAKGMRRRDLERMLREAGATFTRHGGRHDIWTCPCGGQHLIPVPRHNEISAGVVASILSTPCLQEGWSK